MSRLPYPNTFISCDITSNDFLDRYSPDIGREAKDALSKILHQAFMAGANLGDVRNKTVDGLPEKKMNGDCAHHLVIRASGNCAECGKEMW